MTLKERSTISSDEPTLRCLVAVATYNEIENIPTLVDQVLEALPDAMMLVVDDNSPDGTGQWCQQRSASDDRFNCIVREGKLGLGTAVLAKFKYAIEHDYDWLLTMDADHSHSPQEIERLIGAMGVADVIVGSRYVPGGKIANWPWYRRLASRMANALARAILSVRVRDCSGGFRCYRVAKLRELSLDQFVSTGYSFYEEVIWRLQNAEATFHEVPITFTDRTAGQSKAGIAEVIQAVVRLITLRAHG